MNASLRYSPPNYRESPTPEAAGDGGRAPRIERAVQDAPRPYHFVILADHGQSQGAPFRQRNGQTLEDLVGELTGASSLESQKQGTEGPSFLQASVAEVAKGRGPQAGIARFFGGLKQYRRVPGQPPEVVVMASGCLGLISFPRELGRLTLERIHVGSRPRSPACRHECSHHRARAVPYAGAVTEAANWSKSSKRRMSPASAIRVVRLEPGRTYPVSMGGRRGAPPEDCDGPWAFQELRQRYSLDHRRASGAPSRGGQ
jgi:hypothetical protein